ncbi:sucrose phosphorylase [Xylanimonas protaetiae]|uniref:Sucrose phosphorylase n=1 Tax=Xylanimonas protaetiae TaxID=2509457 RepID=A0A4V0YGL6_9MICO|nr:sucrose phosphorylase [Xylanimonas protaetiae]QAY71641.1 sucrose phosphorylase [Xylanimonas protaetiae]
MTGVDILVYADRIGGDLRALRELLTTELVGFAGVHILPFFTPFDGDDAGFDPTDHTVVDSRLGTWADVRALADDGFEVTADLIVNHVSADSPEFRDWLAQGAHSEHEGMFLTFDRVFGGHATEAGITAFYRPRPGLPFTAYQQADGTRRLVWTTFMPSQVDLDVQHPAGEAYLRRVIRTLADGGVRTVRIDAVGYAIKTVGTDSFMTDETLEYVRHLAALCHEAGMRVLVEVHAHYTQQQRIAPLVDLVYDFALPALLLHSLVARTSDRLARWLDIRPANAITVLDTHDGIGIIDAGPVTTGGRELPGLIDHAEMAAVFAAASAATDGESDRASVIPAWCDLPHQINATFYSALGRDDDAYLLCRAVQLFVPGEPQIYYVGLLAGVDDVDLWRSTGQGRDINRHRYTHAEVVEALDRPVVRALRGLVRLRSRHPAFGGEFSWRQTGTAGLELDWVNGDAGAVLTVDLAERHVEIVLRDADGQRRLTGVEEIIDA